MMMPNIEYTAVISLRFFLVVCVAAEKEERHTICTVAEIDAAIVASNTAHIELRMQSAE